MRREKVWRWIEKGLKVLGNWDLQGWLKVLVRPAMAGVGWVGVGGVGGDGVLSPTTHAAADYLLLIHTQGNTASNFQISHL